MSVDLEELKALHAARLRNFDAGFAWSIFIAEAAPALIAELEAARKYISLTKDYCGNGMLAKEALAAYAATQGEGAAK